MDEETKKKKANELLNEGHEIVKTLYLIVKHEDDFQDLKRLERILNDFKKLSLNQNPDDNQESTKD